MAKKRTNKPAGTSPPLTAPKRRSDKEMLARAVDELFSYGDRSVDRLVIIPDEDPERARYSGWGYQSVMDRLEDVFERQNWQDMAQLSADTQQVMLLRRWRTNWEARYAHLQLETAELVEAVRGKRADGLEGVAKEAGDVLFGLVALLAIRGLTLRDAIQALGAKLSELKVAPPYPGEEREGGAV